MEAAIALLKMAIILLTLMSSQSVIVTPELRATAVAVANQAIEVATSEILKSTSRVVIEPPSPTESVPTVVLPTPVKQEEIVILSSQEHKNMAEIKIISPSPGKGLGRTYKADPNAIDDNYIYLGLTFRNNTEGYDYTRDAVVTVTATDSTQNKVLNGTGNTMNIYKDGTKIPTWYYPFHYEFKTPGEHTITFTVNDLSESVTVTVE